MKTTWEKRKDLNILPEVKPDSQYKNIERKHKVFNPV